jgi:hypothetical protein
MVFAHSVICLVAAMLPDIPSFKFQTLALPEFEEMKSG